MRGYFSVVAEIDIPREWSAIGRQRDNVSLVEEETRRYVTHTAFASLIPTNDLVRLLKTRRGSLAEALNYLFVGECPLAGGNKLWTNNRGYLCFTGGPSARRR